MHRGAQFVEDRADVTDGATLGVTLNRLAGEGLPDVGRVTPLQPLGQRHDGLGTGAAGDRGIDRLDARVRLAEGRQEGVQRGRLGTGGPPRDDLELVRVLGGIRRRIAAAGAHRERQRQEGGYRGGPRPAAHAALPAATLAPAVPCVLGSAMRS
jgi:hypothetical protein